MLVVFSVGVAALIWDYNGAYRKNVEEITRKTYGKGKKTEELRVEGKDRVLGEIPIEVTEQVYGEQEISQVLKQAVKKMDSLILGENVSLNHVDRDLNLIRKGAPDSGRKRSGYQRIRDVNIAETGGRTGNTFLYGNELERCSNYGGCSCDFRAVFCAGQAERDKRKTGKTKTDVSGLSGSHQ